jgi:hypothetical protein
MIGKSVTYLGMVALASAEPRVLINREVPPRHPLNRLARLNYFCFNYVDMFMAHPRKYKLTDLCNNWSGAFEKAFERDCGYYNDQNSHGASLDDPKEPNQFNENFGVDLENFVRKRRSDADWADEDWEEYWGALDDEFWLDACEDSDDPDCGIPASTSPDCPEGDESAICRASGAKKLNRLQNAGALQALKSIVTGFRKWGERYISHCHGHRAGNHMSRRIRTIRRMTRGLKRFGFDDCEEEGDKRCPTDEDIDTFRWGKKNLKTNESG